MTRTELIEELRETAERITRYTNSPYDGLMSAAADMLEADGKLAAPAQPLTMVEMVDAAMVETADIYPPITRSQCERIIRAAARAIKGAAL
jgi:hypothetical protein